MRSPRFYLLIAGSLVLWAMAYQQKGSYVIDVGGLYDDAYVSNFHGKEGNDELNYRWSRESSHLRFPGIGNQPVVLTLNLVGFRPDGISPPVQVQARGKTFTIESGNGPFTTTISLDRGDPLAGDLGVTIASPVFVPQNDERELGIIVDSITVSPVDYGLRPVVIPPLGTILGLLAGLVSAYLAATVTLRRVRYALIVGTSLSLLFATLIIVARMDLALLARQLPMLAITASSLAVLGRIVLDAVLQPRSAQSRVMAGAGSAAFALAFILRFGGLTYPQFLSSDLLFQVHRMQKVMGGEWVFPSVLPDGTPVPYPPALYVILSPLGLLFGTSDETLSLVLKAGMALLDSATCLGLAWAGWRLWGGRTGALAAILYAISPAPFELFSAGNYTNLFAQGVLNLTLLGWIVYLGSATKGNQIMRAGLLSLGFALVMLGHYGLLLAMILIVALFGAWVIIETLRGRPHARSWHLLLGFGLSLLASVALYYRNFLKEIWEQFSALVGKLAGGKVQEAEAVSEGSLRRQPLYEKLLGKVASLMGTAPLLAGLFGLAMSNQRNNRASAGRQARALLVSWLGAALMFLLLDQTLGDAVRWYYLAAAAVALPGGRFLTGVWSTSRAGRLLVGLALTVTLMHLLTFWVGDLIFTRYHELPVR